MRLAALSLLLISTVHAATGGDATCAPFLEQPTPPGFVYAAG